MVFIITGAREEGKTKLLAELVNLLKDRGINCGGFLSPGYFTEGTRSHFDLLDLQTGQHFPLSQRQAHPAWFKAGPFYFDPVVMALGTALLDPDLNPHPAYYCIDEVGLFETRGLIWSAAIRKLLLREEKHMIWTVRDSYLEDVLTYFKVLKYKTFYLKQDTAASIISQHFFP